MDYKKEDLIFYKENPDIKNYGFVYTAENEISTDEKLEFVDKMNGGRATYFLNLSKKYREEEDSIKKDKYGYFPDKRSVRGWIKRNDIEHHILDSVSTRYNMGDMFVVTGFCEYRYNITGNSYGKNYTRDSLINEWFHNTLVNLSKQERALFESTDEKSIAIENLRKVYEVGDIHSDTISDVIYHDGGKSLTPKMIDEMRMALVKANNELKDAQEKFDDIKKGIKASLEMSIKYN